MKKRLLSVFIALLAVLGVCAQPVLKKVQIHLVPDHADAIYRLGEDAKFKSDVTLQLSQYETFAARINTMLSEEGGEEHSDSMMRRMSAKLTMALGTLTDSSVSHLADMIIQGATVSITDTTRILREYENTTAAEAAIALARDIIRTEEESIERMRGYL
jgi:hypothetical protein